MAFTKVVLWLLLLPFIVASIGGLAALIEGGWRDESQKFLRFAALAVMTAFGPLLAYGLIWNSNGLLWFALAFLVELFLTATLLRAGAKESGFSWAEMRRQFSLARSQIRNADLVVPKGGGHDVSVVPQKMRKKTDWIAVVLSAAPVICAELLLSVAFVVGTRRLGQDMPQWADGVAFAGAPLVFLFGFHLERLLSARATARDIGPVGDEILYVGCGLYFCGIVLMSFLFFSALDSALYHGARTFWTSDGLAVTLSSVTATLWFSGLALLSVATKQFTREAAEADVRPPILYLRPFSRESRFEARFKTVRQAWRNLSLLGRTSAIFAKGLRHMNDEERAEKEFEKIDLIFNQAHRSRSIYGRVGLRGIAQSLASGRGPIWDEQLLLAGVFNQIGPYIAITRPNETIYLSDVGAYHRPIYGDEWRSIVLGLIDKSCIVVVEAGTSPSLLWEIGQIVQRAPARKILMILPESNKEYEAFLRRSGNLFPCVFPSKRPRSRLMMFDDWWNPFTLENLTSIEDPLFELSFVSILKPFLERNGYSVPSLVLNE